MLATHPDHLHRMILAELTIDDPAAAEVLERFGIDYSCGGNKTLDQACHERGIDTKLVLQQLESPHTQTGESRDWMRASDAEIVDHVEQAHHALLRCELARLEGLVRRVTGVYGRNEPELEKLRTMFEGFKQKLERHMDEEERHLFPAVRRLATMSASDRWALDIIVRAVTAEHTEAAEALEQMRKLTRGYVAPAWACCNYRAMLRGLESLEKTLHRHVHLENNILLRRLTVAREFC